MDDMELMQEWVDHGSEDAFRSIVDRHVNLVYSTARRLVSNPHEAEEVTQTVFILLARKARSLSKETVMAGWFGVGDFGRWRAQNADQRRRCRGACCARNR
jgi:DNA-directed RNA polymerase specialized sigma24 family protein